MPYWFTMEMNSSVESMSAVRVFAEREFVVWNESFNPSPEPFFVVMMMTPFEARDP